MITRWFTRMLWATFICSPMVRAESEQPTRPDTISLPEAHRLAILTLVPSARRFPNMRFEALGPPHPAGFYLFELTAKTPDGTSPVLGNFAVNAHTGDVWDIGLCTRLSSAALTRARRQVRLKLRLTARDFAARSRATPCEL